MTPEQVIQRLNDGVYDPWAKAFAAEVKTIMAQRSSRVMPRYKTAPYEDEIVRRYEDGEMVKNIAADYQVTEMTIHNVLKRRGIVPRRKR